jgi:hypothetical protein
MKAVKRKHAQRGEREANSKRIADLTRAIEELVSRRKKPQELEGLIAEAKALVQQWKIKESSGRRCPLFDDTVNPTTLLLAALVVELRRDHELVEQMRRHFANELESLSFRSRSADFTLVVEAWTRAQLLKLTRSQKYERKRGSTPRIGLIEQEFGGNLLPYAFLRSKAIEPTCLDEIFVGGTVNMLRTVELFGIERHRLLRLARGTSEKKRFGWRSIVKIMDALFSEKLRPKRKVATAGRPPRMPWLNGRDLRVRVLTRIEARINTLSVPRHVKSAFESVVRRHLGEIG